MPVIFEKPLAVLFKGARLSANGEAERQSTVIDKPLTDELKHKGSESLDVLEKMGLLSQSDRMDLENLAGYLAYDTGPNDESKRRASEVNVKGIEKIDHQAFRDAVQDLVNAATKRWWQKAPSVDSALVRFYQTAQDAETNARDTLVKAFLAAEGEGVKGAAEKVAMIIPAHDMPIKLMRELLKNVKAPLTAVRWSGNYYMPIEYTGDKMQVTLGSQLFQERGMFKIQGMSEHARRAVFMLSKRRHDQYDSEAIKQLIFGPADLQGKLSTEPDPAVIAAIAVFRPALIKAHELSELCIKNLPFSEPENKALIEKLNYPNRPLQIDTDNRDVLDKLTNNPVFYADVQDAKKLLDDRFNLKAVTHISVLANFIRDQHEYVADSEGGRWII